MKSLTAILYLLVFTVSAQVEEKSFKIIGRAYRDDSIVLRAAPKSYSDWRNMSRNKSIINRYTIKKSGKHIQQYKRLEEKMSLRPLEAWSELIDGNDFAAVFAQFYFGSDSHIITPSNFITEINKSQQSFSLAMLMADLSIETANYAGLRFVDTHIEENESYLYEWINDTDTSRTFVSTEDIYPLPEPYNIMSFSRGGVVSIEWNGSIYSQIYSGYQVEKYNNLVRKFETVSKVPIVSTNKSGKYYFTDSLEQNKKAIYRIYGISPFADEGQKSDSISVYSKNIQEGTPQISGYNILPGCVQLYWEKRLNADTVFIEKSANSANKFKKIGSSTKVIFKDCNPASTNFYRLKMDGRFSNPYMVVFPDSIPPNIPEIIDAIADTSGIVKLRWREVADNDLSGYRIYRSSGKNGEFHELNSSLVKKETFFDTINLKTLNKFIFYKIGSEDLRYNRSKLSSPFKVKIPDVIPPESPNFIQYRRNKAGIYLRWTKSASSDAKSIELYKKADSDSVWSNVYTSTNIGGEYTDSLTVNNNSYAYLLLAMDSAGNESEIKKPLFIPEYSSPSIQSIELTNYEINRTEGFILIDWPDLKDVFKFLIYRAESDENLTVYNFTKDESEYKDYKIKPDTDYKYAVKAIFNNGTESLLKDIITLNY